jgi:hypothetical protein
MNNGFRIGLRVKLMSQVKELIPQVMKVINLTIEDKPDARIFVGHGLVPRDRQVNNGESAKVE